MLQCIVGWYSEVFMFCSVVQCGVKWRSVLGHVYGVRKCVAARCCVLLCVAACCNLLQYSAGCCSLLLCVAVSCSVLQCVGCPKAWCSVM